MTPGSWPKPVAEAVMVAKAKGAEADESNSGLFKTVKGKRNMW